MKYEEAERLIQEGEFELAFQLLEQVSRNNTLSNTELAEAYNLQGVIISGFAPYLSKEDENGLSYYQKALAHNPQCVGALLNIVSAYSFGKKKSPSMHTNRQLFIDAFEKLIHDLKSQLLETQQKEIERLFPTYLAEKRIN